jgi:hypothetical protein
MTRGEKVAAFFRPIIIAIVGIGLFAVVGIVVLYVAVYVICTLGI